jgi:hypothetical protein
MELDENIRELIEIASMLEAFKIKAYSRLGRQAWFDEFVMRNAPCNYDLQKLITNIQNRVITMKVKPCEKSMFRGIECLESSDQFGFFKSEADVRPSSCIWIDKEKVERLYDVFLGVNDGSKNRS